jgi:RNA polymerase sigma-70 factor (ECF subfamily)
VIIEPCGLGFVELGTLTDEVLIAHLSAGHDDALAVLFDRYHRLVRGVALRIVQDFGEAEDVIQCVFLEVYQVARQFDARKGTVRTWLLQYAYHRSMNRRQHLVSRKFYATGDIAEADDDPLVWEAQSTVASAETKLLVEQALRTLTGAQRTVLELAYFQGLSLQEIAERTNEPWGNVRHHYYRGLSKLRSFLLRPGEERAATYRSKEIADAKS